MAPSTPRDVTATAGNALAMVSWSAPASDGGSFITGYLITGNGGISLSAAAGDRSILVSGLTNGVTYTFSVAAQNAVGVGQSALSAQVTPVAPPGVPGAPTSVVAYAGDALATVNWSAPADQGTSAITSYRVVASPGGASAQATAPSTTATVLGLANGVAYTFIVIATNAAGDSAPSTPSVSVTPSAGPAVSRLPYKGVPLASSYTSTFIQDDGRSLESSASTLAAGGYVLTCAAHNMAGYTLVGIKPSLGSASYSSQVQEVTGGWVPPTLASMGADGYLVTAIIYNAAAYTYILFGTKVSNTTYSTRVQQVSSDYLDSTISTYAADGYVTTAMEYNDAGYTLIGVKDDADPRTWTSQVQQVHGSLLASTVTNMTRAGYAVTAMVSNVDGYTLVGMKQGGGRTATDGVAEQVIAGDLGSSLSARASAGYVTLAMYYGTAGYAFASTK